MPNGASATLEAKLEGLPAKPGVYVFRDRNGKVLYVGKARSLRQRVRSYFQESRHRDGKTAALVQKIADLEWIVTDTEAEALILENTLIKQHRPRYNVSLRDDKTYPFLCIKNEPFPRLVLTRRLVRDGSRYYGPYTDVRQVRALLRSIREIFPLRSCSLQLTPENIATGKFRPCLDYHIGRCNAPCVGWESLEQYEETIRQVEQVLLGHTGALIEQLKARMMALAEAMRFEEAARIRDRIRALEQMSARQKVVSAEAVDRDVLALAWEPDLEVACAVAFFIREGRLIGRRHRYLHNVGGRSPEELLQVFAERYYLEEASLVPREILVSHSLAQPEALSAYLQAQRGEPVSIRLPDSEEEVALLRMARTNAELLLGEWRLAREREAEARLPMALRALARALDLPHPPRRIEGFDNAHLHGEALVGAMVCFVDGRPARREYRHYVVRTVQGPDDFAAMREVVYRRYRRVLEEGASLPDLILVDGGKGQLSAALEALSALGIVDRIPVVGLAKRLEELFLPDRKQPLQLPRTSPALRLLQQIRDEAHRFARSLHHRRRARVQLALEWEAIPGIGPKTIRRLLEHFGSPEAVRRASEEDLAALVGPTRARRLRAHFSGAAPELGS
ncbi:MAG: excinuclease ABC subunit UvrC [Bacteroidetes bacterium]|nr:excinuclease ABC subunit UvrC [Rhodothermia bacterium]MCS7154302.1 excinuclease ABC subunit UvrC [Bacteroidota bacterium]MCX7906662.1 excinuclease ABC subunit UvrC [Bacteroidota bacterium]MDW8137058.1 excinuclease ABC subunit UvrC [Bacteroidota bacterium]MDW8285071.1 excinuclease ABC subunit UvrC [Bacteroidota bacterium]